jgi:small subunit ribosomal protein S11e
LLFEHKLTLRCQVSIRGRILRGIVVSNKMQRSVILRRDYLHYIKKYNRYEKRHKNFAAHVSPCFKVAVGDGVIAGQCRYAARCISALFMNSQLPVRVII